MSTPFPVKVGTNYKDTFLLADHVTGVGVTGKVQGDFTLQLSRGTTGNLATTGITFTEVSAANNPGVYDIVALGTTSFTSVTAGKYSLKFFLTADPTYTFEQTILVTSDGTFAGGSGVASFTATAANGRITDGVNPLTGATVRLVTAGNTIVDQVTSDAAGLWGPVFLDQTVTIVAQKSGYGVNNSSQVTVALGVATGPGVDVALAAVTSSSSILNSDLLGYARVQARNATGTQADTVLQQAVNDAVQWVASAKFWEYYKTYGDITINGSYATGTLTLTNASTTVTLATGTWPAWAASGKLVIAGKVYRVATRSSNAVVLLATAWQAASSAGTAYTLCRDEYTLAADLMKFGEVFPGSGWGDLPKESSFDYILRQQSLFPIGEAYPHWFAIHGSGGTTKVIFYPYPNADELLPYWYYRRPATLVSGPDAVDCPATFLELLQRAVDYQLAMRFEACIAGNRSECQKALMECFRRMASNDQGPINPGGPLGSANFRDATMRMRFGGNAS